MNDELHPNPGVDFSRSDVARYIQLSTLFRRRIEKGEWLVGGKIPTIDALMQECGVARETVRQALGVLEREQWIERFRAKGTFVRAKPPFNRLLDITADYTGLFWVQEGVKVEMLSAPKKTPLPARQDGFGEPLPEYVHHTKRHWLSEIPFLVTENYYDVAVYDEISDTEWETKGALAIMIDRPEVEVDDIRQTMTITTADIETATQLQLPLNAPLARVQRTVIDVQGRVAFYGDSLYRGENVRLDIKLK